VPSETVGLPVLESVEASVNTASGPSQGMRTDGSHVAWNATAYASSLN